MKGRYQELWENREQILRNTRKLLERVKGKKRKFTEQTKRVMKESTSSKQPIKKLNEQRGLGIDKVELKKIKWTMVNVMIPMLSKIGEIQRDLEFLDSAKFGQWNISPDDLIGDKSEGTKTGGKKRRTLKEDIIDRFRQEDLQVKSWKEGSSHPTSKVVGSPLQFTQYSLPYVLSTTGTQTFYDFVERKHPNDFVWGWKDNQQTIVMVLKNPSQRGLEINGVSKKKGVVSEEVRDKLGDDYKEVKPSPHQTWRQYLSRGRNPIYYPKNTISLIWNYESTDDAKRKKEEELRKKYPNKEVYWMNVPNLTWLWIEGTNGVSKKKKPITEKETQEITRVEKFKPEPDDVKKETKYPSGWMGQYRGIHSHIDQYIWNQLGTEKSKEELLDRMEKKLKKGGGTWSDSYRVIEFEEEGKTVLINTWSFDSSD